MGRGLDQRRRRLGLVPTVGRHFGAFHMLLALGLVSAGVPSARAQERSGYDPSCRPATQRAPGSRFVPGEYIVTLSSEVKARDYGTFDLRVSPEGRNAFGQFRVDLASISRTLEDALRDRGRKVFASYRQTFVGFSAQLTDAEARALNKIRGIQAVQDEYMDLHLASDARTPQAQVSRAPVPPGIGRIDQRMGIDAAFSAGTTGAGVHVYVIDSGIWPFHDQFRNGTGTRVRYQIGHGNGFSAVPGCPTTGDYLGHGTHVAGTIGGNTVGVAPEVTLHPVRVFGEDSTTKASVVITAVEWVTIDHKTVTAGEPAVANLSLGGHGGELNLRLDARDALTKLNYAIYRSVESGVTYVVSAGNDGGNACDISPAKLPDAITVGSVAPDIDWRADDSNQGSCVDIFAPGVDIWSAGVSNPAGISNPSYLINMSGTSMAAPHVTGVAALYLQTHPDAKPPAVWHAIEQAATPKGFEKWRGICNVTMAGTHNLLLHWGAGSDDGVTDNVPMGSVPRSCILTKLDGLDLPVVQTIAPRQQSRTSE
jgi:subtilisin family serine protease